AARVRQGRAGMTLRAALFVYLAGTVIWFIIRHPARRGARKAAVRVSARTLRERFLMAVSLTGLGIIPLAYVADRLTRTRFHFLGFADYPFQPAFAWLGAIVFVLSLWLFHRMYKQVGRNWSVSLDI